LTFDYSISNLPEIPQVLPQGMMQLASTLPDVKVSIPTVDKVLEAIEQGKADQVSQLEWIYCISAKEEWDNQNPNRSQSTSSKIWQVAIYNSWLQHQLIWRLALYCNGQKERVLPKSIVDSLSIFANNEKIKTLLKVKVILAINSENNGKKLAKIACEYNFNRAEFINEIKSDIPVWISVFNQFVEYITPHFCTINNPSNQQVSWLLSCLQEMSTTQQLTAVDDLLVNVAENIANQHSQLVSWLSQNYRSGENWLGLSELARKKLRSLIGAINYGDFQKLVELIIPTLSSNDRPKQLQARQEFWRKYSNRFEQIRILLPYKSHNLIGDKFNGDIDILKDDGSDSTEVCIFHFGDWIVVEFFRGRGSEIRLLPNNSKNKQILFNQSQLSVKCIRCLGGEKHDHVYLWQELCPQWLENKGIIPNDGSYFHKVLRTDKLQEREEKLESWKRTILNLEREARSYCERIGCCI
jgi:EH_Signature domain